MHNPTATINGVIVAKTVAETIARPRTVAAIVAATIAVSVIDAATFEPITTLKVVGVLISRCQSANQGSCSCDHHRNCRRNRCTNSADWLFVVSEYLCV